MKSNFAKRKDANHAEIVKELRWLGYSVYELNAEIDLLVGHRSNILIEIKNGNKSFRRSQLEFFATWKGLVGFARSAKEAVNLIQSPGVFALSRLEKDRIAVWLKFNDSQTVGMSKFLKIIGRTE